MPGVVVRWLVRLFPALVGCVVLLLTSGTPAQAGASCVTGTPSTKTTFGSTGSEQCFVVPANVTTAYVVAVGGSSTFFGHEDYGARVTGTIAVTPGSTLYVEVGGAINETTDTPSGYHGGFNGGGSGGSGSGETGAYDGGSGGGGASDVQTCSIS